VEFDKKLAGLKLVRVHAVQQHAFPGLLPQIFTIKFGCHRAPHFGALHARVWKTNQSLTLLSGDNKTQYLNVGDMAFRGKIPE
jgi:hypothetical protein